MDREQFVAVVVVGVIAALLTGSDPGFTDALRQRLTERLGVLSQAMLADIDVGRLGSRVDPDTLVGLLFGAYLAEVLRYGEPRTGWSDRTVAFLAPSVAAD